MLYAYVFAFWLPEVWIRPIGFCFVRSSTLEKRWDHKWEEDLIDLVKAAAEILIPLLSNYSSNRLAIYLPLEGTPNNCPLLQSRYKGISLAQSHGLI